MAMPDQDFAVKLVDCDHYWRQIAERQCDLHLQDLIRCHGAAPIRRQPISFSVRGPSLPVAVFPAREQLATVA